MVQKKESGLALAMSMCSIADARNLECGAVSQRRSGPWRPKSEPSWPTKLSGTQQRLAGSAASK